MRNFLFGLILALTLITVAFTQGLGDPFLVAVDPKVTSQNLGNESFEITGQLGATDQEAQEGYFAVGSETMIISKQGSKLHSYLSSHVGQRVRIHISPDIVSE